VYQAENVFALGILVIINLYENKKYCSATILSAFLSKIAFAQNYPDHGKLQLKARILS
jgi:hypothetical protein